MPTITTKDGTEIFYKDWGSGQPIVFSHGWPLSSDDWDAQLLFFFAKAMRQLQGLMSPKQRVAPGETGENARHGARLAGHPLTPLQNRPAPV